MSESGEPPASEPTGGWPPPPPSVPPSMPPPPPPYYYLPPQAYGYPRDHPQAGLALGLGLGAIIGGFVTLGLGFALGPFAWFFGQRARREVRASNGAYHSEGNATAGMVLGIISTIFLVLAILAWIFVIAGAGTDTGDGGTNALGLFTARS
ncbi:MAG: DUF4190 domain-containing protein [Marmoricola sp.]